MEKWRDLVEQVKEIEQLTYKIRGKGEFAIKWWSMWETTD